MELSQSQSHNARSHLPELGTEATLYAVRFCSRQQITCKALEQVLNRCASCLLCLCRNVRFLTAEGSRQS